VTLLALPELMGESQKIRAAYFNACRAKRNTTDYDHVGTISQAEVNELLDEIVHFKKMSRNG
jgi:hypothetical protein